MEKIKTEEKKQEVLNHWKILVRCVFRAEQNIKDRLHVLMTAHPETSNEEKAEKYVTLVAEEVLKFVEFAEGKKG